MFSNRTGLSGVKILLLTILVVLAGLVILKRLQDLLPPDSLTFAAGRGDSAYYQLAQRYQDILATDGVEVTIIDTAGSVENADLLGRGEADVAFLQGGIPLTGNSENLEAIAATFLEPLWIFHRGMLINPSDPINWDTLNVAVGEDGSGTRYVVDALVSAMDTRLITENALPIGGSAAVDALGTGEADVALFVAPVSAPYLQDLFSRHDTPPIAVRDGEALVRQLPFVQLAKIPRSGLDYAAVHPAQDIELIAMIGRLVAQADLHPALVDRLVNAARTIHADRDLITDKNQFPNTTGLNMAVNAQAANLLSGPPSGLYNYLPWWVVAQINSFALLLLPLFVILVPLMRILPGIYRWRMHSRVYRRYPELLDIEHDALRNMKGADLDSLETRLLDIEREVVNLKLPVRYQEYAYTMRMHIDLVRQRLAAIRELRKGE